MRPHRRMQGRIATIQCATRRQVHDDDRFTPTVDKNYTIPSSTDATGPRNPHRPFRNPLTHPHGPNAMRIPLPPQPHPREQPNGINRIRFR